MIDKQNKIKIKNGKPVVSSRTVARLFNKRHDNVLKDIKTMLPNILGNHNVTQNYEDFFERNFFESHYKTKGKKHLEYLMTEDGFTILIMGYGTKKALEFKVQYIEAFRKMEAYIKNRSLSRMEYAEMTDAIQQAHNDPRFYHYSNEADLINRLAIGMTAKQIREHRVIPEKDQTRDYLSDEEIRMIEKLQKYNTILIEQQFDFQSRKSALKVYLNRLKAKPLSR